MADNNEVKSRRDQHLDRLRNKYPDKKFEDDEEIYGQISDDYDTYEAELEGLRGREKSLSDMFAADPRSAQFLTDMHNGNDPVLGLVLNFGVEIKDVLDDPEMQDKIAEANKDYVERVANSKKLDEEYEKNMDNTLETLRQFQSERGMTDEKIDYMLELRASNRNIVAPFAERFPDATFTPGKKAWSVKCDIALPCATQNELDGDDAQALLDNGCTCVAEGANMPSTPEAIRLFRERRILYAPGKAANAGGVATSGLEMCQNSMRLVWSPEEVDAKLHAIMKNIHEVCVRYGAEPDVYVDYVVGANIGGFMKVANAMLAQGCV